MNTKKDIFKKSTLAGILIGLGVIINLQSDNRIIGALLFSFGLLTIIEMQLLLFTGKVGFRTKDLGLMLLFNFIGIAITVSLYAMANSNFQEVIMSAAVLKFSKSIITLFINACFCGALIHFAVKNKVKILTIFAIMIFILIGAEHCVADFPYLLFNLSWVSCGKLIAIIGGNSIGAIVIEELSK